MLDWAERLQAAGRLGELEQLMLQAAFGEYIAQMSGGIAISQVEVVRPYDLGLTDADIAILHSPSTRLLTAKGNSNAVRMRIAELIANSLESGNFGDAGLDDDSLTMVRDQFRRFVDEKVMPHAHGWHLRNELIPMDVVKQMAELGVFGLTIPEENGGLGMNKTAMCVVTEE